MEAIPVVILVLVPPAVLMEHPSVHEAIVSTPTEVSGEKRLVAFFVPKHDQVPDIGELRDFVRKKLPGYMTPAAFIRLDAIPLTPNGKIDRRALPVPEDIRQLPGYVGPRDEMEQILAEIWQSVLQVEKVGIYDNFFDLGGHSLLAAQVISRARNTLSVELPLRRIFETPNVAGLAAAIYEMQTAGTEDEELAAMLAELGQLTEEEAQRKFAEEF